MTHKTSRLLTTMATLAATTGSAVPDLGAATDAVGSLGFFGMPAPTPGPYWDAARVCRAVLCGYDLTATTA